MTGSVIVRSGTTIVDGLIHHHEEPLSWTEADSRAGRRLDRRKSWAFVQGELCESCRWTQSCSGCTYGFEPRGSGCEECGYHGVVREAMWIPATQGIEARSDETRSGSAEGESPVPAGDAPKPNPDTRNQANG